MPTWTNEEEKTLMQNYNNYIPSFKRHTVKGIQAKANRNNKKKNIKIANMR